MRRLLITLAITGCVLFTTAARAQEFTIDLDVKTGKMSQTAHAQKFGLGIVPKPRSAVQVRTGERISVKWKLGHGAPNETVKDVTVHFFVVKEDTAGQRVVPPLDKGVVAESALTMDFGPKDKAEGQLNFTIDLPGTYLLRLETMGAAKEEHPQEWFAALDVVAQK